LHRFNDSSQVKHIRMHVLLRERFRVSIVLVLVTKLVRKW